MSTRERYDHGVFCWVDLMAPDLEAAAAFYGEMFGWELKVQPGHPGAPPYAIFELGGRSVAGVGEAAGAPPAWNSYVNVDDIDAAYARALRLGATEVFPVQDAMDAGRLAYLRDPEGATFALWEAKRHIGAGVVSEPGAFCWNELCTRDDAAARGFYGELFGWRFSEMEMPDGSYTLIKAPIGDTEAPNGGILTMTEHWGEHPALWGVYFAVADLPAAIDTLTAAGGKVEVPPIETPVGAMAVVSDPQGAHFELIQLPG